ncbi:hypothetical protein F25303_11770 [Fusarium sp. NRRL 25303]|nr:hypothetical protein F25303_11770 [Fusarium sp. NRRL 25303]
MDPFDHLPIEIRLKVLLAVRAKESMATLIRASPTLFRLYPLSQGQDLAQYGRCRSRWPPLAPPPREYLCLPNMHASATDGHSVFRGQRITTSFRTDVLTDTKRTRFLKAFLLFELNCKAVQSGLGRRLQPRHGNPYEVPKVMLPLRDDDALRCIHTYSFTESSLEPGLLFPDTIYLDPNIYMSDLGIPPAHGGQLAAEFAKSGLGLLVELFGYDISDPQQKEGLLVRLEDFWNSYRRLRKVYHHLIVEVSPDLADEAPMYHHLNLQLTSTMQLQKKVFEQRAWVFFNDARLYPSRSIARHFPSVAFLENEGDKMVWFQGWQHNSARIRALCRSQKWHDDYKKEKNAEV